MWQYLDKLECYLLLEEELKIYREVETRIVVGYFVSRKNRRFYLLKCVPAIRVGNAT